MASTIYVRIENTLHKKVIRCLWNIDAQYGIPHRHSDALKALQDHQIFTRHTSSPAGWMGRRR